MIDSRYLIIICLVYGIIGCLFDSGQCHRPLNTNITQQQQQQQQMPLYSSTSQQLPISSQANAMYHQNAKNGFQQTKPDYQQNTDSKSPAYSFSSVVAPSSSLSGRYFSSAAGSSGNGRATSGGIAAIALAAAASNAPTSGNSAYQPNRGRKHAFTDLRKNLTSQGRLWERQGDDPERNDHNNNPMKILKNKILKSDVSIGNTISMEFIYNNINHCST